MTGGDRPRVVCVGDLMTDVVALAAVPTALGSDTRSVVGVRGGGAAANTAAWLATTGWPVSFVGRVGGDLLGRAALAELADAGVDVRAAVDDGRPTGTCVVVVASDGARSMYPDAGANAALAVDDLPADLLGPGAGPAQHLHLSGYSLLNDGSRPAALEALRLARAAGHTVSIDPASAGPILAAGPGTVARWLAGADLLLVNEDEAAALTGDPDPLSAGAALLRLAGSVVVKLGPAGAAWFGPDGASRVPAVRAEVVDTTGAGDCFAAGFLPAWLSGLGPLRSLEAGCSLAARVVAVAGARPPG